MKTTAGCAPAVVSVPEGPAADAGAEKLPFPIPVICSIINKMQVRNASAEPYETAPERSVYRP